MTNPVASQHPAPIRRFRITPTGRLKEDPFGGGLALYSDCEVRIARLEAALRWALGEEGDFPVRSGGDGMFWWRKELRVRAALATPLGTPGKGEK